MTLKALVSLLSLLLAGCVANTPAALRHDPASLDGTLHVPRTPEETYRVLRPMVRECLEQAPLGTPVVSDGEFDVLTRTGQIRQRMTAQGVLLTMTIIDMEPLDHAATRLTLYTMKGWKGIGVHRPTPADLVRWMHGDTRCWIT